MVCFPPLGKAKDFLAAKIFGHPLDDLEGLFVMVVRLHGFVQEVLGKGGHAVAFLHIHPFESGFSSLMP